MDKSLIGIAGAHFVAGELSRKGYISTLTSRNTEGIDILASNKDGSKTIAIQVKTTAGKSNPRDWILSEKIEKMSSKNLVYVFVNLKSQIPEFFIVPSKDVAKYAKTDYDIWIKSPNKKGGKHHHTTIRMFRDRDGKYLNRWDLLGL